MPTFEYVARDERGAAVTGTLIASSAEAVADQLKRTGYLVTRTRQVKEVAGSLWTMSWRRVGYDELMIFTVQLSKLIQVGVPIVASLETVAAQTEHPQLRAAVAQTARAIESGSSFSEALKRHPRVFPSLLISMVQAGELSGRLDDVLRRMAEFARRQADLRQQLQTALAYPVLLLVVSVGVIALLVTGVIPKFMAIFLEAGVPLPLPTRILHSVSLVVRQGWPVILAAGLASAWVGAWVLRRPEGRYAADRLLLRLPVIGSVARKAVMSRFARTFETLLASGVPILESLAILERTCGNAVMAQAVRRMTDTVKQGGSLTAPLKLTPEVPPMVTQMMSVGETSGTLDHMLGEIADYYDEVVRHEIKRATALIEPAFLLVIGGLVALIMASLLLPLFRMVNVIH